jgi:hypothetical protein
MLGGEWLPAALAPSMPAAYSSMLEQLGCSREVGLWLAGVLSPSATQPRTANTPQRFGCWEEALDNVMAGLYGHDVVRSVRQTYHIHDPQLAGLYLSLSAVTLQWLSSMEPGRLTAAQDWGLASVCEPAARACRYGLFLSQHEGGLPSQQQQVAHKTHSAVVQLAAAVLEKLLGECREVLGDSVDGPGSSTGFGGNSSSMAIGNRSVSMKVMQACCEIAAMLEGAFATADEPGQVQVSLLLPAPAQASTAVPGVSCRQCLCCMLGIASCCRITCAWWQQQHQQRPPPARRTSHHACWDLFLPAWAVTSSRAVQPCSAPRGVVLAVPWLHTLLLRVM